MDVSSLSNTERPEDASDYRLRLAAAMLDHAYKPEEITERATYGGRVFPAVDRMLAVRDEEVEALFELLALHKQRDAARTVEAWRHYAKYWRDAARKADAEMAALRSEVEKLRADLADANATLTELAPVSLGARLEHAEAIVARVRRMAEDLMTERYPTIASTFEFREFLIAALEGRDS